MEGRRARLGDFTYYTQFTTKNVLSSSVGEFECPDGAEACTSEQYANIKTVWSEFDVSRTVNAYNSYLELDQTLGWFNVRAGVRFEYEDYFKNFNISPRLVGTITPFSGLSLSGGFNRYYQSETLYYALRDAQPRGQAYTRDYAASTGQVEDRWVMRAATGNYNYEASDLDTPYKDEYTAAIRLRDPLLNGNWRLRYSEHHGRDLFSAAACESGSTTVCRNLTNDGESFYRSASAEYTKFWHGLSTPFFLNGLGFATGITWSEQSTSRTTYLDLDEDEYLNPIYYNGQSYSQGSFVAVTGNLDIPVRIGATLSTNWLNDRLLIDISAGYNLGYDGVYDTGDIIEFEGRTHDVWEDTTFKPVLNLDLSGQIVVTEQAAIEFHVNNLLNTAGNKISTNNNPWVRGRSYWIGSTVKF